MVAKLDFDFAEANLAEHIDLGVAADKDPVPPAVGADPGLLPVDTFAGVLGPRMVLEKQLGWAMGPQLDKTVLGHLFELRVVGKACFAAAAAKADIVAAVVVVVEVSVVELEKRTVAAAVEAAVVAEANAAAVVVVAVGDAIVAAVAVVVAGGDAVETVVVAAFEVVIANMAAAEAAMEHSAAVADLVVVGFPS